MNIHDAYDPDKKKDGDVEILYDGYCLKCLEKFPPEIKTIMDIMERAGKVEKTSVPGMYKVGDVYIRID